MRREAEVIEAIRAHYRDRLVLFRNNVGQFKKGAHYVRFGVGGVGGADLIGFVKGSGEFVAIEVKRDAKSKATAKQTQWLNAVRKKGARALLVHGDNFTEKIDEMLR